MRPELTEPAWQVSRQVVDRNSGAIVHREGTKYFVIAT
jgi:hypothetical protein